MDLEKDKIDGQLASCILQGIINRESKEKIYITNTYCYDNMGGGQKQVQVADVFLEEILSDIPQERLSLNEKIENPGFYSLFYKFKSFIEGLIIFDPDLEQATIEAGTTIAGQTDSIVVSPEIYESLKDENIPVIENLREYNFKDNIECLKWLKENYFSKANKEVAFTWSHMTTDQKSWGTANKDYVVANKLFTFYLNVEDEERDHYQDIVNEYPPGTPIMGWADESWSDEYFASLGYFMVPYISVENLTVMSSFPTSSENAQPEP